jgi:hypothetical protein
VQDCSLKGSGCGRAEAEVARVSSVIHYLRTCAMLAATRYCGRALKASGAIRRKNVEGCREAARERWVVTVETFDVGRKDSTAFEGTRHGLLRRWEPVARRGYAHAIRAPLGLESDTTRQSEELQSRKSHREMAKLR